MPLSEQTKERLRQLKEAARRLREKAEQGQTADAQAEAVTSQQLVTEILAQQPPLGGQLITYPQKLPLSFYLDANVERADHGVVAADADEDPEIVGTDVMTVAALTTLIESEL